jgi:hypothetical protein
MTAPNAEVNSIKDQLTDANADGTCFGQSTTDCIAFYGKVPVPQRSHTAISAFAVTGSTSSYSAASDIAAALGNWTTLVSASGVSSTVSGWTATGALTASSASFGATQAAALTEVVKLAHAIGLLKAA